MSVLPAQNQRESVVSQVSHKPCYCFRSLAQTIKSIGTRFFARVQEWIQGLFSSSTTNMAPESDKVRMRKINQVADLAQTGTVYFYDQTNRKTAFLGNFFPCKVSVHVPQKGSSVKMDFLNAEAAYQACKFSHRPDLQQALTTLSGPDAWQFAQDHRHETDSRFLGIDWFSSSDAHMKQILMAKFSQNPHLQERLFATSDAYLVEHTVRDAYWGDGGTNGAGQPVGKNRLGHLLMEVRKELGGAAGVVSRPAHYLQLIYDIETKHAAHKDRLCSVAGCSFSPKPNTYVCHPNHNRFSRL